MITLTCCTDKRRLMPVAITLLVTVCFLAIKFNSALAANLPAGFTETIISGPVEGGWREAVGMTFDTNGRMYVWERGGKVWIQDTNDASASILIDIAEEVGAWSDHGLLGFTLDPNFHQNGYI